MKGIIKTAITVAITLAIVVLVSVAMRGYKEAEESAEKDWRNYKISFSLDNGFEGTYEPNKERFMEDWKNNVSTEIGEALGYWIE